MKKHTVLLLIAVLFGGLSAYTQTFSFVFDGLVRSYDVHLPPSYNGLTAYPLVFELHGSGATTATMQQYTRMIEVADTANFIVVYPEGIDLQWNNGYGSSSTANDVGFISALIDTLQQDYNIDTNRVYATGGSAGGFMCYRLACEIPWRFAAIASVSGLMGNSVRLNCQSYCSMPIMHFHGTADAFVSYTGTPGYVSVDSTMHIWVDKNNCPATPITTNIPDTSLSDSCNAIRYYYGPGDNGAETILYKIINGGHTYPGGALLFPANGNTNMDMIASVETWNFFRNHTRQCQASGIKETYAIPSVEVFPNPASNSITISTPFEDGWLTVYNMQGQKMHEMPLDGMTTELNISMWAQGIYIVEVVSEKGFVLSRFIKE